ncbi:actin filament-associated protein 1-like 2 isoform X2 [Coturnix japonica]|uniref:actin filament-associated protein 1-like 2 isoform X2 n=1 Tax=Coturnix japonica TaxID=93934 RepID=UPI0007778FC5|nr:actin filament-associated protein 1-like 2 isoform X2 [Coturnix japonica]
MEKYKALEQLLTELEDFLRILDKENLSSTALVKKSFLSDLLRVYTKSSGGDEEYIYMNKVTVNRQQGDQEKQDKALDGKNSLTNGDLGPHSSPPQKSLPELPPPKEQTCSSACLAERSGVLALHALNILSRICQVPNQEPVEVIPETKQPSVPKIESPEGYYEEAEPYDVSMNGLFGRLAAAGPRPGLQVTEGVIYATITMDGEAVSSSYESYDEEESSKGKSATHQWPSTEATIELMKDARICAFLWRKKWLGQWAKQLCVIKDTRLLCYKSSKDHSPQLDVNLLGCTVIHKEKQVRKKEHKLKIIPMNADVIVLGLQSKDQAEQWLRVIQETSGLQCEGGSEGNQYIPDSQRLNYPKVDLSERYSAASESGSSTDGHPEAVETKDVKKKGTTGLKLSNLMNLGRKKSSSLDSPERSLETSSYLNVLVNSQWKSRWCQIKDGHLHFYQDKNRSKLAQQPLSLAGCEVIPEPSPDHLYSFRILHNGEERVVLEAKSSEEMGHWLGLLLSESGSKTDPEEFTYDYVDADRVSCIVSAAKNSFFLMQRKYSEPNAYIDNLPKGKVEQEELYDDVDLPDVPVEEVPKSESKLEGDQDRVYLDLTPVKSFLHCAGKKPSQPSSLSSPALERAGNKAAADSTAETAPVNKDAEPCEKEETSEQKHPEKPEPEEPPPQMPTVKIQTQQQNITFPQTNPEPPAGFVPVGSPQLMPAHRPKMPLPVAAVETKLGKNRTEAEVKRFTEEKERLEKEKDEIRAQLTQLRKERRELKEMLASCTDKNLEQRLKEIDEECKRKESRRVDLELSLVEVKENLKKAESGPVTLGTTVDTTHLENTAPRTQTKPATPATSTESSPVNSATALKNRPLSVMVTGKGTVLQKAKEWEKKGAS